MTSSAETERVVRAVGHKNIKMQFDTGAIWMNREDPKQVLTTCSDLIGHYHLSEPGLLPIGDQGTDHANVSQLMREYAPSALLTLEMLASNRESNFSSIKRALGFAQSMYRSAKG